jgi:hypothetical protein
MLPYDDVVGDDSFVNGKRLFKISNVDESTSLTSSTDKHNI